MEHEEITSNLSEIEATSNRLNPMENPKPSRKPRCEVWWLDLGPTNHSLMSVVLLLLFHISLSFVYIFFH